MQPGKQWNALGDRVDKDGSKVFRQTTHEAMSLNGMSAAYVSAAASSHSVVVKSFYLVYPARGGPKLVSIASVGESENEGKICSEAGTTAVWLVFSNFSPVVSPRK